MALRGIFYRWLIPAAFVLPIWLFIGWVIFGANAWSLLWVLISAPIVFFGQLILTLMVRARGTVRAERGVSWSDFALIGTWHVLVIALGFFANPWWWLVFAVTVAVGIAALISEFRQMWRESRPIGSILRTSEGVGYIPAPAPRPQATQDGEIIVIHEKDGPTAP